MSDQPSSSKNSNTQWMYEGTKSIVNREDYLLGKKIDRNFELFSDVVIKDKEEENQENFFKQKFLHNDPKTQKISALDVRTVRNEDPLVALKEQRRRQVLENPVLKLKVQKILQKEFKKKIKKEEKKLKKKEKKMKELHTKNNKV